MTHDVAIVGAGIVGLATARALLAEGVGSVVVLEAEEQVAHHQSSRNSGVIHSGLYYRPGSLKARNCAAGREAMYAYCEEKNVPHERCGKLVVATREDELPRLEELRKRGTANGLAGLRILERDELRALEPEVDGIAGIHVEEAGVVDFGRVARALADDVIAGGGEVRTGSSVQAVRLSEGTHEIETAGGRVHARTLVNCAGLRCDRIARMCGVDPEVQIVPFRGEYYDVAPEARRLVRNPVYPVPDPAFPFLGVHVTPTIHGTVEVGPNAVLAFRREGYRWRDVSPGDLLETLTYPGFLRLAARHWRYGMSEMARSMRKGLLVKSVQRLVPRMRAQDLARGRSGVRAQAVDRKGRLLDDFHIERAEGSLHVLNAPSPAATASLSIGEQLARQALDAAAGP